VKNKFAVGDLVVKFHAEGCKAASCELKNFTVQCGPGNPASCGLRGFTNQCKVGNTNPDSAVRLNEIDDQAALKQLKEHLQGALTEIWKREKAQAKPKARAKKR
jgi:hypothetical protein